MSRRHLTSGITLILFVVFWSADAAFAANCVWVGLGPDNRWSTAANWALCNGRAPINGDDLRFLAGEPRPASQNDIPGLEIRNLIIDERAAADGPYDISGLALVVRARIRAQAPAAAPGAGTSLRLPLVFVGVNEPAEIVVDPGAIVSVSGAITAVNAVPIIMRVSGRGTLVLSNPASDWEGLHVTDATVRLGAPNALPDRPLTLTGLATLDLNGIDETVGRLIGFTNDSARILLGAGTLTIDQASAGSFVGTISGSGGLVKNGAGTLSLLRSLTMPGPNTYTGTTILNAGGLTLARDDNTVCIQGPLIVDGGVVEWKGDHEVADTAPVTVNAPGRLFFGGFSDTIGSLSGSGGVNLGVATRVVSIGGDGTDTTYSGTIIAFPPTPGVELLEKMGVGTLTLTGDSNVAGSFAVRGGRLVVDGRLSLTGVTIDGGILNGTGTLLNTTGSGTLNTITLTSGTLAPGNAFNGTGILHADEVLATGGVIEMTLRGTTLGTQYSQLDLTTFYRLAPTTRLSVVRGGFFLPRGTTFTIINLAGNRLGEGTFQNLPEGATFTVEGGQQFSITYRGGDGNDVVLTSVGDPPPITYFLSEGATGGFFDEDIAIANPHDTPAPVTLTFSKENGEQVVATRTVPASARLTIDVESIPGLEATSASAQVRSDAGRPLVVERSMFWEEEHYAGHTGGAVAEPDTEWFFAEGSQGFFKTFVLVINPHATPTDVTFTFFRENEPAVVKTMTLGASARLTLSAGDVPELVDRSFGIAVRGTQPIMAERSMYFGTTPTRFWSGGHASAGVTAPSTEWFLAEGATGGFFDTFILLSNPQNTGAQVTLRYLLDTGETVTVPKTIAANARLTTNIEAEADARLHNAAVSTVVTSDVPIIAERSMYWPGAARPWGEAHNSFGVVRANTAWGLAEGRVGGPLRFQTYILLANPQAEAAEVTVTFLREAGEPIRQTYTVPPTSRFNVDASLVPGLADESFGAAIAVGNGVPIIVERSMYWDVGGILFSGGTNATGIALAEVP